MSKFCAECFNIMPEENATIADLYCMLRNYTDLEHINNQSAEYAKLRNQLNELYRQFEQSLNPDQKSVLTDFVDMQSEVSLLESDQSFLLGFKTAVRLLVEGLR